MTDIVEITLNFDKTISNLTGNKYGRNEFDRQVKDNIAYDKKVTLHFPDNIRNIASSFIQGFFDAMVKEIGIDGIESSVDMTSNSIPGIKEYILKKLKY